jgi:glycosyltransferase involved in cell wall biosynthesis
VKIVLYFPGPFDRGFGGGQVYVRALAVELLRRGHAVAVLARDPWLADGKEPYRIDRRQYGQVPVRGIALNPRRLSAGEAASETSPLLQAAMREVLSECTPDVVHVNGWMPSLCLLCRDLAIPHLVTAHHPGEACPNGALLTPEDAICQRPAHAGICVSCVCRTKRGGGVFAAALAKIPPWVYRPVGAALNRLRRVTYAGRVLMYPWLVERRLEGLAAFHQNAQLIVAPSQAIAKALLRNGVPSDRMAVVPHGIEPLPRAPLEPLGQRPLRFAFVGRIDRTKGFHILLRALARVPAEMPCELHVIGGAQNRGDQEYFDACLRPFADCRRLILHGHVPHAELAAVLAQIDVLVLPAIYLEVFGLVVLEAFSVGRPVIASRCGGPEELIRHGVDGLLFPRNDAAALADIMKTLIQHPEQIAAMAANIRPVRTLSEHVDDLERIYQRVLQQCD